MPVRQRIRSIGKIASKPGSATKTGKPRSELDTLFQQESARIRLPLSQPECLQAVLMNTAGGLTGDDHISWQADAGAQTHLSVSTAACEKIYRTHGPAATQISRVNVGADARLDWLPQETIIFNGASLNRQLEAHVDESATALFVESLVLGRQAMRETITSLSLHDRWRLYRGGSLLHAEDLRIVVDENKSASKSSMLHHYNAATTVVLITPLNTESLTLKINLINDLATIHSPSVHVGVSNMAHRIVVRALAHSSFSLRNFLIPCVELLSDGAKVPTVWKV